MAHLSGKGVRLALEDVALGAGRVALGGEGGDFLEELVSVALHLLQLLAEAVETAIHRLEVRLNFLALASGLGQPGFGVSLRLPRPHQVLGQGGARLALGVERLAQPGQLGLHLGQGPGEVPAVGVGGAEGRLGLGRARLGGLRAVRLGLELGVQVLEVGRKLAQPGVEGQHLLHLGVEGHRRLAQPGSLEVPLLVEGARPDERLLLLLEGGAKNLELLVHGHPAWVARLRWLSKGVAPGAREGGRHLGGRVGPAGRLGRGGAGGGGPAGRPARRQGRRGAGRRRVWEWAGTGGGDALRAPGAGRGFIVQLEGTAQVHSAPASSGKLAIVCC